MTDFRKMTREDAVRIFGEERINKLESVNAEPTSRLINPSFEPEHAGKDEWESSMETPYGLLLAKYYLEDAEDAEDADWNVESYEFQSTAGEYWVMYNSPVEAFEFAKVSTLEEAIHVVEKELQGEMVLDERDTDNGSNHHWFEVFDGQPVDEDENFCTIFREPLFVSEKVYN